MRSGPPNHRRKRTRNRADERRQRRAALHRRVDEEIDDERRERERCRQPAGAHREHRETGHRQRDAERARIGCRHAAVGKRTQTRAAHHRVGVALGYLVERRRAACDERCSGDGLRHRDQVRAARRAEVIPGRAARDDQKVQTRLREREVVRKRVRRRDVRRAGDGGRNILHAAIPTTDAAFANLTRHDRSAITSAVVSTSAPQTT